MGKKITPSTKPAAPATSVVPPAPAAPAKRAPKAKTTAAAPVATPAPAAPIAPAAGKAPAKAKKAAKAPAAKKAAAPKEPAPPPYTSDDIALRAYFIAEKRNATGQHGDPHQDWIEAERQLASEAAAARRSRTRKSA